MKILIAHYKYYVQGGPERYMFKFMELVRNAGHEVIPFSVNYPTNEVTDYSAYFVGNKNAGGNYDENNHSIQYLVSGVYHEFHNREAYNKLRKVIKIEKPDILYVLIPGQLSSDIFFAAHKEKIPIIHRVSDFRLICGKYTMMREGSVCDECMNGNFFCMVKHKCIKGSRSLSLLRAISCTYTRLFRRYRYVNAVITPPFFTKELLTKSGFFPARKVFVNPTFIDTKAIIPNYRHENYVLCLGRFSEEKGFQYVIEAMKYLRDVDIKVYITGEKNNSDRVLQSIISEYSIEDKVVFIGFLHGEKLKTVIMNSLCIAAPAIWYENMPNTILEAYAYGKPVIASRIGSLPEFVKEGETGLLFNPKDCKQIADAILTLLDDEEKYDYMAHRARQICEEEYSPEKHLNRFMEICSMITPR